MVMSRTAALTAALVLLTAFVSHAPAGVIRHDVSDGLYTGLAASTDYASVGTLTFDIGASSYLCSASLIDPNWVLTAAHCVDGATNLSFHADGTTYAATDGTGIAHPNPHFSPLF